VRRKPVIDAELVSIIKSQLGPPNDEKGPCRDIARENLNSFSTEGDSLAESSPVEFKGKSMVSKYGIDFTSASCILDQNFLWSDKIGG